MTTNGNGHKPQLPQYFLFPDGKQWRIVSTGKNPLGICGLYNRLETATQLLEDAGASFKLVLGDVVEGEEMRL